MAFGSGFSDYRYKSIPTEPDDESRSRTTNGSRQPLTREWMDGKVQNLPQRRVTHELRSTLEPVSHDIARLLSQPICAWGVAPHSLMFKVWNPIMVAIICMDAFLQPVMCAFLPAVKDRRLAVQMRYASSLGWYMYVVDSLLQLVCQAHRLDGCGIEKSLPKIAFMYLSSFQFRLDLVTIIPWATLYESQFPHRIAPGQGARAIGMMAFSLLRLFRCCRLSTVPRLVSPWHHKIHISFVVKTAAESVFATILLVHILACIWAMIGLVNPSGGDTWINMYWRYDSSVDATSRFEPELISVYIASCHWAVATTTSIGYGDIVASASNDLEIVLNILLVMTAAAGWSIVVANAVKLVNDMHRETEEYRITLDTCEQLFLRQNIERPMRHQIREYFHKFFELKSYQRSRELMRNMSPMLQRDVVQKVYYNWISFVPWISKMSGSCLVRLVFKMGQFLYIPREFIPDTRVTSFVELGTVFMAGRILRKGDSWGTDMTIEGPMRRKESGFALNFVQTLGLSRRSLEDVLEDFPDDAWMVKRVSAWWALRRMVMHLAKLEMRRRSQGYASAESWVAHVLSNGVCGYDHDFALLSDDSRFLLKQMQRNHEQIQKQQESLHAQFITNQTLFAERLSNLERNVTKVDSALKLVQQQVSGVATVPAGNPAQPSPQPSSHTLNRSSSSVSFFGSRRTGEQRSFSKP